MLWLDEDRLKQDYTVESGSASVLVLHMDDPGDSSRSELRDATAGTGPDSEINIHSIAMADQCTGVID